MEMQDALGRRVRAVRIAAGLTQADLARQVDVSVSSVKRLEAGASVGLDTFVAVARALGRADWLEQFDPVGDGPSPLELLRERRGFPRQRQRASRAT